MRNFFNRNTKESIENTNAFNSSNENKRVYFELAKNHYKEKFSKIYHKLKIFTKDHLYLLLKNSAENHLRIQKIKLQPITGEQCNLIFESYSDLKRYQRKVRIFTYSFSSTLASIMFVAFAYQMFFAGTSMGATYNFIQNSWIGGESVETASHPDDITNWNKYQSKDAAISAGSEIKLDQKNETSSKTSDADFGANTQSNTYVADNSVKLLKLSGASCTTAAECADNSCVSNLCTPTCSSATACGASCAYNGDVYATVQIGSQCWFRENLRTTKYPNGTNITKGPVAHMASGWYDFNSAYYSCPPNATNNGEDCAAAGGSLKLGMMYQWKTIMNGAASDSTAPGPQGICPPGWHLPVDSEVTALANYYGGLTVEASTQLRTVANDKFSIPLSGQRREGYYENRGLTVTLWQATERSASETWGYTIATTYLQRNGYSKDRGFSVRCLKD